MNSQEKLMAIKDSMSKIMAKTEMNHEQLNEILDSFSEQSDELKSLVNELTDLVNNFSFEEAEFVDFMMGEHRTLQQSFTRLSFAWMEFLAEAPDRMFDPRNKQSQQISKWLLDGFEKELKHRDKYCGESCKKPSQWLPMI